MRVVLSTASEYVLDSVFFLFPSPLLILKIFCFLICFAASGVSGSTWHLHGRVRDLPWWSGAQTPGAAHRLTGAGTWPLGALQRVES